MDLAVFVGGVIGAGGDEESLPRLLFLDSCPHELRHHVQLQSSRRQCRVSCTEGYAPGQLRGQYSCTNPVRHNSNSYRE